MQNSLVTLLREAVPTQKEAQDAIRERVEALIEIDNEKDAQEALKLLYVEAKGLGKPFGETVADIMREKGITKKWRGKEILDAPRAEKLTGLNRNIFRTNMWNANCVVDMALVISMAIGFELSPIMTDRLLQSAGLAFRLDNPEHIAYIFLLEYCRDLSIPECNKILENLEIRKSRQLGSMHRGKNGEFEGYNKDDK